jgi:GntR family transcriptional regulator
MVTTPLYVRIERELRARIGQLEPGSPLPSEPALAAEFGVARMTVRAAVNRLETDGLVERVPGRGTFTRREPVPRPAGTLMSFHDQVRGWGAVPSSRVLAAGLRTATAAERTALQLLPEAQVVAIVRVRLSDTTPIAVEHARFGPGLAGVLDADLERGSLHAALRERGHEPTLGSATITAQAADADADALAVPATEPLLVETRLIVDQNAVPLEFTESRYVGARYALRVAFDVRRSQS